MAERIFDRCRCGSYMGMKLRICDDPVQRRRPQTQIRTRRNSPTFFKQIDLNFEVQLKCQHFQIREEETSNTTTLIDEHIVSQHPFATFRLPISILEHGDKTLKLLLFREFHMYRDIINIEHLVDEIIKYWVTKVEEEEEDQENSTSSRVFKKIYRLEITLELLIFQIVRVMDYQPQVLMMVPTSDSAMESMLKRVENEEIMKLGDDDCIHCVICLEEIGKEEKGSEGVVLQMPCLHVFHGECINKWLNTSHYCPTCRFPMPIN
uniref:RING-type E3 ubiquitin transferase n=1 Tax=Cucumis sativus TaxID=3659 RepID=A0A0A0K2A5_CUCSA